MTRVTASRRAFCLTLAAASASPAAVLAAAPAMTVYKDPYCGCCDVWVTHVRDAGFKVTVREIADMGPLKTRLGVPEAARSCHTGVIGGYFAEGHVPAAEIKRLLAGKPEALGLAVPGMPIGSPGMEIPSGRRDAYSVLLVGRDGRTSVFKRYG